MLRSLLVLLNKLTSLDFDQTAAKRKENVKQNFWSNKQDTRSFSWNCYHNRKQNPIFYVKR